MPAEIEDFDYDAYQLARLNKELDEAWSRISQLESLLAAKVGDEIFKVEAAGFRVLRPMPTVLIEAPADAKFFVIADTETIGKDPRSADTKLIELGLVRFAYNPENMEIYGPVAELSQLKDPGVPIPAETTMLTHITDEMVVGQRLDYGEINNLLRDAEFIVCHNVSYDMPVIQREVAVQAFKELPWLCTMRDIDWLARGINGTKLEYLGMLHGFFYEAHRASIDCHAVGMLLCYAPCAFEELVSHVSDKLVQVWAVGANFSSKDILKGKGFLFDSGTATTPKAWNIQCPIEKLEEYQDWLLTNVYAADSALIQMRTLSKANQYAESLPAPTSVRITKQR